MGPHRIIHNSKGYLTETVFDEALGRFVERLWPPQVQADSSAPNRTRDEDPKDLPAPRGIAAE